MLKIRTSYALNSAVSIALCPYTGKAFNPVIGFTPISSNFPDHSQQAIDPDFYQKFAKNVVGSFNDPCHMLNEGEDPSKSAAEILVPVDAPELERIYVMMALDVLDGYVADYASSDPCLHRTDPRQIVEQVLIKYSFDFDASHYENNLLMCGFAKATAAFRMLQLSLPIIKATACCSDSVDEDLGAALQIYDKWKVSEHPLVDQARLFYADVVSASCAEVEEC